MPFSWGQERGCALRGLQSRGEAEEMQEGIVGAPQGMAVLWEPCGPCAMTQSMGPFWGTHGCVPAPL